MVITLYPCVVWPGISLSVLNYDDYIMILFYDMKEITIRPKNALIAFIPKQPLRFYLFQLKHAMSFFLHAPASSFLAALFYVRRKAALVCGPHVLTSATQTRMHKHRQSNHSNHGITDINVKNINNWKTETYKTDDIYITSPNNIWLPKLGVYFKHASNCSHLFCLKQSVIEFTHSQANHEFLPLPPNTPLLFIKNRSCPHQDTLWILSYLFPLFFTHVNFCSGATVRCGRFFDQHRSPERYAFDRCFICIIFSNPFSILLLYLLIFIYIKSYKYN